MREPIRLQPRGSGRFASAAFLLLWLAGWSFGEVFAIAILGGGAWALATGGPFASQGEPLALGPAAAIGLFLVCWLTLWTIGGIAAIAELLRLLWAEDVIVPGATSLVVEGSLGPFRSRREIARNTLRRIRLGDQRGLVAVTTSGSIVLSSLGTAAEREEAAEALQREFPELRDRTLEVALPDDWEEMLTPEGHRALVRNRRARAKAARAVAVFALLFLSVTLLLVRAIPEHAGLAGLAAVVGAFALPLVASALWLAKGRIEWRIEPGRLVQQRRFGRSRKELFTAVRLELATSADSDGDRWHELFACADDAGAAPPPAKVLGNRVGDRRSRKPLWRQMHDEDAVRALAQWLASRASMPLHDGTTPEAQAAEKERLTTALEDSGRFARWVADRIRRADRSERKD